MNVAWGYFVTHTTCKVRLSPHATMPVQVHHGYTLRLHPTIVAAVGGAIICGAIKLYLNSLYAIEHTRVYISLSGPSPAF